MSKNKNPIVILVAAIYAISTPVSREMRSHNVGSLSLSGYRHRYGTMMLVRRGRYRTTEKRLHKSDIPYVAAMILFDIATPILMMSGLKTCSTSNTSLLNNFGIVATVFIAQLFFCESVERKLWMAIILMTTASMLHSLDEGSIDETLTFSPGSLLVLGATVCWGLENNCTRQIADLSPGYLLF